jgi:hypothetical protein
MPGDSFEVMLHDVVAKNDEVLKDIRERLEKAQNGFVMTREDLVDIEVQLAMMAFVAAQAQKSKAELVEQYRNETIISPRKHGQLWSTEP